MHCKPEQKDNHYFYFNKRQRSGFNFKHYTGKLLNKVKQLTGKVGVFLM